MFRFNRALLAAGAATAILGLSACKPPAGSVDTAKETEALKQADIAWSGETAQKDAAKMAAHYAPDALLADPTPAPAAQGRKDIEASWAEGFKDPAFALKWTPDRVVVARSGELGYVTGTFDVTYTDPATKKPAHGAGVYTTVYSKDEDGRWKATADFAHLNPSASPAH